MPASPATSGRIHESLYTALARKRVVLWYDHHGYRALKLQRSFGSDFDDF